MRSGAFEAIAAVIPPRALVAFTGGGGKTSLMFGLAERYVASRRVIVTTTTKIRARDGDLVAEAHDIERWRGALSEKNPLVVGGPVRNGKLTGVDPALLDAAACGDAADYILVEADGARMRPFKAYAEHEPVVPSRTNCQIVLLGAEVFVEPISEENTFRLGLMRDMWRVRSGERIAMRTLAEILESRSEYLKNSPEQALKILVVNKCDLLGCDVGELGKIAGELMLRLPSYGHIFFVSLRTDRMCLHEARGASA